MLIICDIDGTLACLKARYAIAPEPKRGDKKAFQKWLDKIQSDEMLLADRPINCMWDLLYDLDATKHEIIYLTGRSEKYRKTTQYWLDMHEFPSGKLVMRANNDWRPPAAYKEAKLKKVIGIPKEPWLAIDDDYSNDCSEMYRRLGATHLKVMGDRV